MTWLDQPVKEDAKYARGNGVEKDTEGGRIVRFSYDDFRAEAGLRIELRNFLESEVGKLLMHVMRKRYVAYDVPNTSEALVSARILSQFHGANIALDEIELLSIPPEAGGQPESGYGAPETDHERMPSEDELRAVVRARYGENS